MNIWLSFPWILAGVLGLALGSFANVLIHRVPQRASILYPPSSCPHCGHRIRFWENIPLLSWILLRASCSGCGTRISFRYPLVELACGLLALSVAWRLELGPGWLPWLMTACLLLALAVIDLETMRLPNPLTMTLGMVGLLSVALYHTLPFWGLSTTGLVPWDHALLGMLAGGGSLWAISWIGWMVLKKESMGSGDIKLMAALGLQLGWKLTLLSLFVGSVLATIYMLAQTSRNRGQAFPFGPWLALAAWLAFLYGNTWIRIYLEFILSI